MSRIRSAGPLKAENVKISLGARSFFGVSLKERSLLLPSTGLAFVLLGMTFGLRGLPFSAGANEIGHAVYSLGISINPRLLWAFLRRPGYPLPHFRVAVSASSREAAVLGERGLSSDQPFATLSLGEPLAFALGSAFDSRSRPNRSRNGRKRNDWLLRLAASVSEVSRE